MRQRIIYLLKHNTVLQALYRVIMGVALRFLGHFIRTDENVVLFVCFMGLSYSDSPKVIYEYMKSHTDYEKYCCVWAFENPAKYSDLKTVKIDTLSYFKIALKAKYWITNTNIERGLKFKKRDQIYLNTWHGVALKLIGNDVAGRKDFDFRNVNYLCVCGDYDERVYKTAFKAEERNFLRCGLPRNEELWTATEDLRKQYRQKLNLPDNKKVILYAPTWRESTDGGKSYSIKPPIHFDEWEIELGEEYVILFRAHHQTTKVLGIQYNEFIRDVSTYPSVNELMIASDFLITDYSAIAFDYSILCRPILCYAYDYDTYLKERGTYFDIDEKYPNKSCRTEKELLLRIQTMVYETECQNTRRFRDDFIQYGISATETCVKAVFQKG